MSAILQSLSLTISHSTCLLALTFGLQVLAGTRSLKHPEVVFSLQITGKTWFYTDSHIRLGVFQGCCDKVVHSVDLDNRIFHNSMLIASVKPNIHMQLKFGDSGRT